MATFSETCRMPHYLFAAAAPLGMPARAQLGTRLCLTSATPAQASNRLLVTCCLVPMVRSMAQLTIPARADRRARCNDTEPSIVLCHHLQGSRRRTEVDPGFRTG